MGIVSTNVFVVGSGSSSDSSGGANGADLPTRLSSLSANGGNKFVTLSLGYDNTDLVTGVQINYKTDDYPVSPADGQSVTVSGAAESVKIEGLTNTLTYYFRVFLYHEVDGVKYYQTDVTNARVTGVPRALEISSTNILSRGAGYVALHTSQTFTLSAPAGTKITIGGGGFDAYGTSNSSDCHPGNGGRIIQVTLTEAIHDQTCTLTIGSAGQDTVLQIGDKTYTTSSGTLNATVNTKLGTIGGKGSELTVSYTTENYDDEYEYCKGGDGGGLYGGSGGAIVGHVVYGGNGGGKYGESGQRWDKTPEIRSDDRYVSCSTAAKGSLGGDDGGVAYNRKYYDVSEQITSYRYCSGGGGGGYSGGGGAGLSLSYNDSSGGKGGQGIAVFEWNE